MASPADRFTRMQKIAIFLIAVGEEKTRQILIDLDIDTIEQINAAIAGLGALTPQEKAAVMIEFGDMFFKDIPLKAKLQEPPATSSSQTPTPPSPAPKPSRKPARTPAPPPPPQQKKQEDAARTALEHLKERVDPGNIDWGRAGYDFGEGFKGPPKNRR